MIIHATPNTNGLEIYANNGHMIGLLRGSAFFIKPGHQGVATADLQTIFKMTKYPEIFNNVNFN